MLPRKEQRLPVDYTITYSVHDREQEGRVTNLSVGGSRVVCKQPLPAGTTLLLRVCLPDCAEPLEVRAAKVKWSHGAEFGLKTLFITAENQKRLRKFLDNNYRVLATESHRIAEAKRQAELTHPVVTGGSTATDAQSKVNPLEESGPHTTKDAALRWHRTDLPLKGIISDISLFMSWMVDVSQALDRGDPLPATPAVETEEATSWVQFVQRYESRCRLSESKLTTLARSLEEQQGELKHVLSQLHQNIASLYETLGQAHKADEVRRVASSLLSV